ncbi:universal stress protein [Gordoniibacillus kamchatkensis]
MGSRGLGGLKEFVLGSVSHSVVQKSKMPVFIIKHPSAKGGMTV